MKNILFLLFLIPVVGYSQMNTFGGIGLRVNDTTTYQAAAAAYHAAGYFDWYFNNQATSEHWDIWNGSSYDHIFDFNTGGAGASPCTAPIINTFTADHTLAFTDRSVDCDLQGSVRMNVGSANEVVVPLNSTVAFEIGTRIDIYQLGTGLTSIDFAVGVTINAEGGLTGPGEGKYMVLTKVATNEWDLAGTGGAPGSWPLQGAATQTGDVAIDGDGNSFSWTSDAGTSPTVIIGVTDIAGGKNSTWTLDHDQTGFEFDNGTTLVYMDFGSSVGTGVSGLSIQLDEFQVLGNGTDLRMANNDFILETDDDIILTPTGKVVINGNGFDLNKTLTPGGTTGAQTINKMSGTVNFAAGQSTLVVTNSLATATSMIWTQVLGVDTTPKFAVVTRAPGSFTITLNAVAVAELTVAFWVTN